jgi:FkbH-like protein
MEPFEVFLATGFESLHLATFLAAHLRQRLGDRPVRIQTGVFGDLTGNLQRLRSSSCVAGACVLEWPDFDLRLSLRRLGGWTPSSLPEIVRGVREQGKQINSFLEEVCSAKSICACLPTLALPPVAFTPRAQISEHILQIYEAIARFASEASRIPNLKLVNPGAVDARSPLSERGDVRSELATGFPYRLPHASLMAELLATLLQPTQAKKGLITDLDDTLWRGIVGEDGVEGVSWDLDHHSHIHALYQQLLAALAASGVLLAVATKNAKDAAQAALRRKDLLVPFDRLYPQEINWGLKSKSISRVLQAWNIGPESVVFVDDSAFELEEVKSVHPGMECCLFPTLDEQAARELMEHLRDIFGKSSFTEEDAFRIESVRRQPKHDFLICDQETSDLVLAGIESELTFALRHDAGDIRALDLINKTNQFNLTGRRYAPGELKAALDEPGSFLLVASYRDKFGPLGKIGVVVASVSPPRLRVKDWVMSCRAFSRRIEFATLAFLFSKFEVEQIEFNFRPTKRNGPLREFLEHLCCVPLIDPILLSREDFELRSSPSFARIVEEPNA